MPYSATASATISRARPTVAMTSDAGAGAGVRSRRGDLELRRALRDHRVLLPHEHVAVALHLHHHAPALAEWVRHDARVAHADGHRAVRVANAEPQHAVTASDRAVLDSARERVGLARDGRVQQLPGGALVAAGAEARVDERARGEQRCSERDDETDPALAGRVHAWAIVADR